MFGDRPTVGQRVLVSLMGVRALLPEPFPGACMKITEKDILHTASLARLNINEAGFNQTIKDLKNILAYFTKLQDLDTKEVQPFSHSHETENRLREDIPEKSLPRKKILENAPSIQDPFLKVPKIIEV